MLKNRLAWQCIAVICLSFVSDFVAALHFKQLVNNQAAAAMSTIIIVHYLGLFSASWFVDAKRLRDRFLLTTAGALGAGIATYIVVTFFP